MRCRVDECTILLLSRALPVQRAHLSLLSTWTLVQAHACGHATAVGHASVVGVTSARDFWLTHPLS